MLSELFGNIKSYGMYVKTNGFDESKYWNNIREFIQKPEQKQALYELEKIIGKEWNIETKISIDEVNNISKNTKLIEIIRDKKLNLVGLLETAYNLGQLSNSKILEHSELYNFESYIKLSQEQIDKIKSNTQIQDLFTNLNNFIILQMNQIQSGGMNIYPLYIEDIDKITKENDNYRKVIYTGENQQFVLMSIQPNDDIKFEVHKDTDQFMKIEQGEGKAYVGENEYELKTNSIILVPSGMEHRIVNTGSLPLKLYTIYSPAEHEPDTDQKTNPDKQIEHPVAAGGGGGGYDLTEQDMSDKDYKDKYFFYKNSYVTLKKFMKKYY